MSTTEMERNTRSALGRLLGLIVLVLLIPVIAIVLIAVAVMLTIAFIIDAIMLAVNGTEFAIRKVLTVPEWLGGNIKWLITGSGQWRWVP